MAQCPTCGSDVPDGKRFCGDCGAAVDLTSAPTKTSLKSEPPAVSHPTPDQARFIPGTVLAKRYRIVGLLGRGGMGEVYRADDLKLGQPVALKFLPQAVQRDQARLARFLNEVKTALKVSHPNVCRVHDIGEVDGQHYLSMEYVDGEDLASLLRRIERLPQNKAVQIARQLCAGLAAAHEQGILHRDLKPANVMIDGRGRAKITDFGLAGLAEGIEGDEVRAGTPQYMSPEQHAGKEVTVRSDLYSLGLVLYELFTGKRAFEAASPAEIRKLQEESSPKTPSSHVEGLDQAVERIILRCLEKEPSQRPSSALAIAAALPGGDPLAEALAAGETPSPEMVAAAGPHGGLPLGVAAGCLAAVIVGLGLAAFSGPTTLYGRSSMVKSRDALEENARVIARGLGYTQTPVDHDSWFDWSPEEYLYLAREDRPQATVDAVDVTERMLWFTYRQSPFPLIPRSLSGTVSRRDPPPTWPGELEMVLDLRGRLVYFQAVSPPASFSEAPPVEPDWPAVFEAVGLEIDLFEPTRPTRRPAVGIEVRRAWKGNVPRLGEWPVRIEAGACEGKVVYFEHVVPWDPYWSAESLSDLMDDLRQAMGRLLWFVTALAVLAVVLVAGAVLLAMRNLRLGRGDRRGATRLAIAVLVLRCMYWLLSGHHVASVLEFGTVGVVVASAVALAVLIWILYIALEPYVRRLWPQKTVSWSRLIAGRFRDPLVGRDLLIGFVGGVGTTLLIRSVKLLAYHLGILPPTHEIGMLRALKGGRHVLGQLPYVFVDSLFTSMAPLVLLLLFRAVFRRTWLAAGLCCLAVAGAISLQFGYMAGERASEMGMLFGFLMTFIWIGIMIVLLLRAGLLVMASCALSEALLAFYPVTVDTSAPYFGAGLFGIVVAAAIAAYGFRISLGARPLFKETG